MDRRNGGDPLAPPRPPKSLPRVHRPRAPEPDIVNLPINFNRMDSNLSSNSSISSSSTTATTTHNHLQQQQPPSRQHSIPPPLPPLTPTQQQTSSNRINSNSSSNNNNNNNNNNINNNMNMNMNNNNNIINNNNNNINSNLMSTTSISTFSRRRPDVATGSTGQLRQLTTPLPTLQVRALTPSTLGQITSVPSTNFISTALSAARTPSPVNNSVTLQIPRPENERLPNEYVDTPFTNATANASSIGGNGHGGNGSGSGSGSSSSSNVLRGSSHHSQQQQLVSSQPNRTNHLNHSHTNISTIDGISVINNHNSNNNDKVILPNRTGAVRPNLLPITKQPSFNSSTTTLCKKDQLQQQFGHDDNGVISSANNNNGLILNSATDQLNSITCPQCNRCRCEECQRPRKLPSRWICDDNCFCSAETIIDFASCLCCVKALYYHCSKDHELDCESDSISCADNPCSCVPYKRTSRWGCLSALSLLLPCLLCYWPMRGCVSLCAKCYAKHSRHGCRCNNEQSTNNNNNFNSRLNIINLTSSNGPESPQPPTNHHHHRRSNNNDLTPEKRLLDSSNSEY